MLDAAQPSGATQIPPPDGGETRSWFARHKIMTGLLILILIGTVGNACDSDEDDGSTGSSTQTGTSDTERDEEPESVAVPEQPESVTVPVTKKDRARDYRVKESAVVSNEEWDEDEVYGAVTLSARDVGWEDNWAPALRVTVHMKGGDPGVHCEDHRSSIWSDRDRFSDFLLKCESELQLSKVRAVTVTGSGA